VIQPLYHLFQKKQIHVLQKEKVNLAQRETLSALSVIGCPSSESLWPQPMTLSHNSSQLRASWQQVWPGGFPTQKTQN